MGRLRKASKEQCEMATAPPRAPSKAEYDSLRAAPETSATMTVTPSMLGILEKAAAPNASAGAGGGEAPEALRAAAASRTPRASKGRLRTPRASKERYEMLEADDGDEPDGSLPPPAEGRGSQPGTGRSSGESSGEQGDLMFATEGRIRSAVERIRREGGEL